MLGLVGEPASVLADTPSARVLAAAVTEALVRRDARDDLVATLAESVPTLDNGGLRVVVDDAAPAGRLVATMRIRARARWQDGQPITAADVEYAWEQDRLAPAGSEARAYADRVDQVEVLGDDVVRLHGRDGERWDGLPLAAHVLPRHLLAGATPEARAAYARSPVHAGPFEVAAWLPGYGVTLAAFPDYVGGRPALGRIEVRFFQDRIAVLDALRRGDVDVAPAPVFEADLARSLDRIADGTERSRLQTYYTPSESLEVLRFGPRFADARLRQAVQLTVDRQSIVDTLLAGRARVPRSYLVPPLWAAADLGGAPRPDRTTARALLEAAGYRAGNLGIMERGAERLVITIVVASGSVARADAARMVAGDLAAIGIAADVRETRDLGGLLEVGSFDLAVGPETASDALLATERYVGRCGPWFDVLANAARTADDRGERRALFVELQRTWADVLPGLPLYQHLVVDVAPRALTGVQPSPGGLPLTWNAAQWRFVAP